MTFICFIESNVSSAPHMEPLMASGVREAIEEARGLMAQHSSAIAAHIFLGDERVETITPAPADAGASRRLVRTPSPAGRRSA